MPVSHPELEEDDDNSLDEGMAMMVLPHFTAKRHLTGGNPRVGSDCMFPPPLLIPGLCPQLFVLTAFFPILWA